MMKAKQYFDEYGDKLMEEMSLPSGTLGEYTKKVYTGFLGEMNSLIESRHVKTDDGVIAILKELNRKWNALCELLAAKYGVSPLAINGFYAAIKAQVPEVPPLEGGEIKPEHN